jgi:hypothetical protein
MTCFCAWREVPEKLIYLIDEASTLPGSNQCDPDHGQHKGMVGWRGHRIFSDRSAWYPIANRSLIMVMSELQAKPRAVLDLPAILTFAISGDHRWRIPTKHNEQSTLSTTPRVIPFVLTRAGDRFRKVQNLAARCVAIHGAVIGEPSMLITADMMSSDVPTNKWRDKRRRNRGQKIDHNDRYVNGRRWL